MSPGSSRLARSALVTALIGLSTVDTGATPIRQRRFTTVLVEGMTTVRALQKTHGREGSKP